MGAAKKAKTEQKTQKTNHRLPVWVTGILIITAVLYFLAGRNYQNVFFPATIINGINVSGLTPEGAQDAINTGIGEYVLTLEEDSENTEQISGSSIGIYAEDSDTLQNILNNQNMLTWGVQAFYEKEYFLEIKYDEEKLRSAISSLSCMDESKWVSPENAYIDYDKTEGYQIVSEVPGNEILADRLFDAVSNAVRHQEKTLSLRDADVYRHPKRSSDDASLQEQLSLLQSYSDMTVTYLFGDQKEILDSDTISQWISVNKSGKRTIDREAVTAYVKELAKKYNTAYSPKTLETSYGETVTIKNGYYGWMIDKETEVKNLMEILRQGKSVSREPAYLMEAASHDGPDYGDTYVEINLTAQHLFFYKDGELIIESDFVSGNPSRGNDTPGGAFSITYKERNATLKGQNYRTPVSYWMPFNGNIGMHDSSWRSTFGGSIYRTNGSHGCINLPPAVAETIFENIEQGFPVLCYHLSGTEQAYATNLSGDKITGRAPAPEPEPEIPVLPEGGIPAPDVQPIPEGENAMPDNSTLPEGSSAIPEMPVPSADGTITPNM